MSLHPDSPLFPDQLLNSRTCSFLSHDSMKTSCLPRAAEENNWHWRKAPGTEVVKCDWDSRVRLFRYRPPSAIVVSLGPVCISLMSRHCPPSPSRVPACPGSLCPAPSRPSLPPRCPRLPLVSSASALLAHSPPQPHCSLSLNSQPPEALCFSCQTMGHQPT